MKKLKVAIAGLGTIGSGVAHILEEHSKQSNTKIELIQILEHDHSSNAVKTWMKKIIGLKL